MYFFASLALNALFSVCASLTGNISRNCTSAGWSDIFPNITSVCGSNTSQDKVRASSAALNVPDQSAGEPFKESQCVKLKPMRPAGSDGNYRSLLAKRRRLEGRGVEQQRKMGLMGGPQGVIMDLKRQKLELMLLSSPGKMPASPPSDTQVIRMAHKK